ncbi:MAG: hypothetical protein K1X79_02680 [Oligoflexia bacterium]|nr:hypothetical protein [Oligoflexia bacterium]
MWGANLAVWVSSHLILAKLNTSDIRATAKQRQKCAYLQGLKYFWTKYEIDANAEQRRPDLKGFR